MKDVFEFIVHVFGHFSSYALNPVTALSTERVVSVHCGASHSLALTAGGSVYSWGKNTQGQCGAGTTVQLYSCAFSHSSMCLSIAVVYFVSFSDLDGNQSFLNYLHSTIQLFNYRPH